MSKKYTETLLKKFKMESCKTVNTPLVTGEKYQKEDGSQKVDGSMYRSLIGSLLYLTHKTRYYVRHKSAIKVYAESEPSTLCSSKKNSKILTRISGRHEKHIRLHFSLGSGIFSWASKKQATVAQSSAEAEYIAAAATSNQAIWLRRILEDIERNKRSPRQYTAITSQQLP
ncbi:hypothetical protein Sango_2644500 [Sesamum angolense]|uniref:Uncharacterized protein n=1 Tax=Sesamum angolense TaxID=2727404 RepID=A0AAE2BH35_9LAMI|nr:hypothetical protein Sango_2644500 [Sesamum angolense]